MTRKSTLRTGIVAGLMTLAMLLSTAPAFAKGGPPPGKGGETSVPNNLSVPAIFVDNVKNVPGLGIPSSESYPTVADAPDAVTAPTDQVGYFTPGTDENGVLLGPPGYYYIQGVATWRAQYSMESSAAATAKWGDNLLPGSGAKLMVGHPVRVEMGLNSATLLTGFKVIKLQPDLPDRQSKYGTLAIATTVDGVTTYTPDPAWEYSMPARVWGPDATLSIDGGAPIALPGEINATGAVVFGYNWRPTSAGTHTLTFNPPADVTVSGALTITVNVVTGGGGGGGRGGNG